MADILKYTPTANMASSERTLDGYYACIKAWVQEIYDDVFSKWFTVEYSDDNPTVTENDDGSTTSTHTYTIVFTSKLGEYTWSMTFDLATAGTLTIKISGMLTGTNLTVGLSSNAAIWLYSANYFFIGTNTQPVHCGFMRATQFDGTDKWIRYIYGPTSNTSSSNYMQFWEGSVQKAQFNVTSISQTGTTEYYVMQNMIPYADTIMTDMFYLTGGMSSAAPVGVFKIGDNKYCTAQIDQSPYNALVKL